MSGLGEVKSAAFEAGDKQKAVDLLNFITAHAKFDLGVKEVIEFHQLLSWSQNVLLKKIEANTMGTPKTVEPEKKGKGKGK
jgi:hypothetical protein